MIGSMWQRRARIDAQDSLAAGDGRPREAALELHATVPHIRMEEPFVAACPAEEGELVHRRVERRLVAVGRQETRRRLAVGGEAGCQLIREEVEILRPAIVAERPKHLNARRPGGLRDGRERGEVESAVAVNQAPLGRFTDRPDAHASHEGKVLGHIAVVLGGGEHIHPGAMLVDVAGCLESTHPEGAEGVVR